MIIYNENEPFAAEWLNNLCAVDAIAAGHVDGRDIKEVRADDVRKATQAHFFAGIGAWSLALRLAGWPDDRPVWTGSCPCQPFSVAGRGAGADDPRHLWPAWFLLIRECHPPVVLGEQVASPSGRAWLDAVSSDLETLGYAVGSADLCAAGAGAPHIRQRLFWVAYADDEGLAQRSGIGRDDGSQQQTAKRSGRATRRVGDADHKRLHGLDALHEQGPSVPEAAGAGEIGRLGDASGEGGRRDTGAVPATQAQGASSRKEARRLIDEPVPASPWADCAWLECRDGKTRPTEPGTFPLAPRTPSHVGRLRAYGNAIVPQVAARFVMAFMEAVHAGEEWEKNEDQDHDHI